MGDQRIQLAKWGEHATTDALVIPEIHGNQGEIDIVEGVNDQGPNAATLHTSPGERASEFR